MVLYESEFPGNEDGPGNEQGSPGGGGCGPGQVETALDAQGRLSGGVHCVSPEEADKRRGLFAPGGESPQNPNPGSGGQGSGSIPPFTASYGNAPRFNAPRFNWDRRFIAPSQEEALNDPGYQFGLKESLRGLEQSAAARGNLRTGGTLKALTNYANNVASQRYQDVYNRRLGEYGMEYGQARDKYGFDYTASRDEYSPLLAEWMQRANSAERGVDRQWNYWSGNNLTAAQLWQMLMGL